jgi:hypothetical protein
MNNILENKLSMFEKVQAMLTLHSAETTSIPAVATTKAEFDALVAKILLSAGSSSIDITGYTVQKQNKRNEVTKALLKITTAFSAWASLNNQPQDAEKADITPAGLDALRDNDFYTYAQQMNLLATPNIAALAPFGVLPADNTTLATKAAEFLAIIEMPKARIGDRSAEFGNLERLIAQANDVLTLKLDPVMRIFVVSNPTLYDAYTNARSIDDTGAITQPDYEGSIDPTKILLVADIPFLSSRTFKVSNTGNTQIAFCLSTADQEMQEKILVVAPNSTVQRNGDNLQTNANLLLIQNPDPAAIAQYEVRILE